MGGFLLIKKQKDVGIKELERLYGDSISVFDKKGLSLNKRIVTNEFVIYVFNKYQFKTDNLILLDDDQFVISTGTFIYNGKTGSDALKELYRDFSPERQEFLSDVIGEYCLIVSKKGKLYLLNDYTGLYRVYCDESRSVISSSFLAVLKTLKQKNISVQEFYEYAINGAFYGDKTLIKEIDLINSRIIWQLSPVLSGIPKALNVRRLDRSSSFDEMVREVSSNLVDYFNILKTNFGNSICSALTGGFDCRLMLALMRKVGIEPYLYVYGDEDYSDVKIAKLIAGGEGLALQHENRKSFPKFEESKSPELIEKNYYMFDGLGHENGIFDNGSDLSTRLKRIEKAKLQLNGGAGTIFRNFWKLPDKAFHIKSFLDTKRELIDYSIFSGYFDKSRYFSNSVGKIKVILNVDKNRIDRQQIEMLYPFWRAKYWMAFNNSINNQLTYSLTPFADMRIFFQSFDIPVRFKQLGQFEAALIKFIDPRLAKYASQYGFNFYDNVKLPAKIKEFVRVNTPPLLRPYIRKYFINRASRYNFPFYLGKEYVDRIFPSSKLNVSEYIHVNKIDDPNMLSRVLSVELLITDRF